MSERLIVVLQRRAVREIEAANEWWRENRPAAPDLLSTELEAALASLALVPGLGAHARNVRALDVQRVLLPRSGYYLYYRVRNRVEILALWHGARGPKPGL